MELTPKDYADAMLVQDACNLSGVVHSFSRVMSRIRADCDSTQESNRHPIAILYSDKIASLTGTSRKHGARDFSAAYDVCETLGSRWMHPEA